MVLLDQMDMWMVVLRLDKRLQSKSISHAIFGIQPQMGRNETSRWGEVRKFAPNLMMGHFTTVSISAYLTSLVT